MRGRDGFLAVPAALATVAVSAALAGAFAELARFEAVLSRNRLAMARALAAADGCLATAVAVLPAGWSFDAVVAGPDATAGTADDGHVDTPPECDVLAVPTPGPSEPHRVLLDVAAEASGGRRRLEAVVGRAIAPGVPAVVWATDAATLPPVMGTLDVGTTDALDPSRPPLAPLAAPGEPEDLDAWLGANASRVRLVGAATAPRVAPPPPLVELAARLRAAGAATGGIFVTAGVPPPVVAVVAGDLTIGAALRGAGLLVVDGLLDIQDSFEFTGIVVASNGVRVGSGARLAIDGGLWLGGNPSLVVDGTASVTANAAAVDLADGLATLPRLAVPWSSLDPD